jgi:hypothetical protein
MECFAGIDVSLEQSGVCVVDGAGKIVHEAKAASEPEALVGFFRGLETRVTRIGLERGLCRNGCTPVWSQPGLRWCCSTQSDADALQMSVECPRLR